MAALRYHMLLLLGALVAGTPLGTNRGLLHVLWMLTSGALLVTRGAVIPGLRHIGLTDAETRRAWAALGRGKWTIDQVLARWERRGSGAPGRTAGTQPWRRM